MRPSALLQGSLVDLNIDVAFGMELIEELDRDFSQAATGEGLGPGIAQAVRLSINTGR